MASENATTTAVDPVARQLNAAFLAAIVLEDPVHSLTGFLGLAGVGLVYFLIGRRPRPQIA